MQELLRARDLTVVYPGRSSPALIGVHVSLVACSLHLLLGRNGAGKSTLMHAALGLLPLTSGSVDIAPEVRCGWCAQRQVIDWFLGVFDNVLLGARLRGLKGHQARAAAERALSDVGLSNKAGLGPEELSGGEQQRLMVARTLAYEPSVYVLDEPFVGLDAVVRSKLMSVLRERAAAGAAVLVSSHELGMLEADVSCVTLLDRGRVAFNGSPDGFYARFMPCDTVDVTLASPVSDVDLASLGAAVRTGAASFRVDVPRGEPVGGLLEASERLGGLSDVVRSVPTLDDAVLAAYGAEGRSDECS